MWCLGCLLGVVTELVSGIDTGRGAGVFVVTGEMIVDGSIVGVAAASIVVTGVRGFGVSVVIVVTVSEPVCMWGVSGSGGVVVRAGGGESMTVVGGIKGEKDVETKS